VIGRYGTRRARRGCHAGDGRVGIRPRRCSGCTKFPLTPVCLSTFFFPSRVLNNLSFYSSDVDYDPSKEARAARKTRIAKNEGQRLKNLARSQHGQASTAIAPVTKSPSARTQSERKGEIQRTLVMSRASTASMGKFDRMLEGEKKPRGVKRKVMSIQSSSCHVS
jgi:hypothetical protein